MEPIERLQYKTTSVGREGHREQGRPQEDRQTDRALKSETHRSTASRRKDAPRQGRHPPHTEHTEEVRFVCDGAAPLRGAGVRNDKGRETEPGSAV